MFFPAVVLINALFAAIYNYATYIRLVFSFFLQVRTARSSLLRWSTFTVCRRL